MAFLIGTSRASFAPFFLGIRALSYKSFSHGKDTFDKDLVGFHPTPHKGLSPLDPPQGRNEQPFFTPTALSLGRVRTRGFLLASLFYPALFSLTKLCPTRRLPRLSRRLSFGAAPCDAPAFVLRDAPTTTSSVLSQRLQTVKRKKGRRSRGPEKTKADIEVALGRRVPVAKRRTHVPADEAPTAAAKHAE